MNLRYKYLVSPLVIGGLFGAVLLLCLNSAPLTARAAPGDVFCVTPGGGSFLACDQVFSSVQVAVDAASGGEEIRVASATYSGVQARPIPEGYPEAPASGLITQALYISKSVTLRGGYTTPFTDPPDPEANPTTLNAQGQGRVVVVAGTGISATLEGLQITGGDADGLGGEWRDAGGGLYVINAALIIRDSEFSGNSAWLGGGVSIVDATAVISATGVFGNDAYHGGGLYLSESAATLNDNVISLNAASGYGGGLYLLYGDATLEGNVIVTNTATSQGGGLYLRSNADISGNTISGNTAKGGSWSHGGGGVYVERSPDARLSGNTISANTAEHGGGLYMLDSAATVSGNAFSANTAGDCGGGVYLYQSVDATLGNNTVISNTADRGGGLCLDYSDGAALRNNTVATNSAANGGGLYLFASDARLENNFVTGNALAQPLGRGSGLYVEQSRPQLHHNTVARNHGGYGEGLYATGTSLLQLYNTILVSHSVGISVTAGSNAHLQGTLWGSGAWANSADWSGNVSAAANAWGDPAFVDPDAGDYHIGIGSAAVDAGSYPTLADDVDGESRPAVFGPDIGADERPGPGLWMHKEASRDVLSPGQTITYTLVVTGIGTGPVSDVVLVDRLPPEQRLVASVAGTGVCSPLAAPVWGGGITCELGALNVGQSARITLTAQVTTALPPAFPWRVRNSAWATGTQAAGFAAADVYLQDCHVRLDDEPGEWDDVQAAVDASTQPGDVVKVAGYCAGASSRSGTVQMVRLEKTLTLQGGWNTAFTQRDALSFPTTLDALGQGRVLYVAPPLGSAGNISPTLEGLRITGGDAGDPDGLGGGMYLSRTAALIRQTRVFSNAADEGGGLYLLDSAGTNLVENAVLDNSAAYGAGLYLRGSAATLNDNIVSGNVADSGGGLFLRDSAATLNDNVVSANTSHVYGGGMYLNDSAATLNGNDLSANTSYYGGGGLYLRESPAMFSDNAISDNVANTAHGGGMWLSDSAATLSDNVVSGNTAGNRGGGLYLGSSPATFSGNAVFANTALQGGGLYLNWSDARLNDIVITANTADDGGGLFLTYSNATLTNTVIADNQADVAGSGLYVWRSASRLWHTTVARNTGGSGIYVLHYGSNYSSVAMTNTILMGHGVGISLTAGNTATLESTLWYSNSSDWEGAGALFTGTHNYQGDPRFDASGYRLLLGSAAIDKGLNVGVMSDIDGNPRPFGPAPDLGASEAAAMLAIHKTGPATAEPGGAITYTLHVTNSGVYTASAVVISDALPAGAHYVSGGTLLPGDVVGWSVGNLAGGASAQAQFVVTATETVVNSVYGVTCAEGASAQGAEDVVTAIGETPALLSISKTGPATAAPGEPITYTLTIVNHGAAPLNNLVVSDTLPVGAVYVSGGTLLMGDVVSWTVASLAGGAQAQVQFVVTAMGTIVNEFYGVTCAEGISATGSEPVVTVGQQWAIYLPVAMKGE